MFHQQDQARPKLLLLVRRRVTMKSKAVSHLQEPAENSLIWFLSTVESIGRTSSLQMHVFADRQITARLRRVLSRHAEIVWTKNWWEGESPQLLLSVTPHQKPFLMKLESQNSVSGPVGQRSVYLEFESSLQSIPLRAFDKLTSFLTSSQTSRK